MSASESLPRFPLPPSEGCSEGEEQFYLQTRNEFFGTTTTPSADATPPTVESPQPRWLFSLLVALALVAALASVLGWLLPESLGEFKVFGLLILANDDLFTCRLAHGTARASSYRIVVGTRKETWCGVNTAMHRGRRGLPGGSTLRKLLVQKLSQRT